MQPDELCLILGASPEDAPFFSAEYQSKLKKFAEQLKAPRQRAFTMDGVDGGGGPLGEFLFANSAALITGLVAVGVSWLNGRSGRKLRLKMGEIEAEAGSAKELEEMLKLIKKFEDEKVSAAPVPAAARKK